MKIKNEKGNIIYKRSSLYIFFAVVKALLLREIITRFGSQKLGYLWAVIESMSSIVVFAVIKEMLHSKVLPGISYPVFLASGFVAYNMFRNITMRSMDAFSANKGLFVYKQVKPFDTLVSRSIIEFILTGVIVAILLFIGWYLGFDLTCKNILGVMLGYLWIAFFGFSLGVFFAVISFFYENFKKIINLIFLPLYFMSALFYTLDSLPPIARKILLFNPVVHFMEMIHGNYFYPLHTDYVNYYYMLCWCLTPLFTGLWIYKRAEKKIIMS